MYMITRPEIGFTDRPRDIRNPTYTILPIQNYCTLDLVLFSSEILGRKQKCQIKPLKYRLVASSQSNNDASSPMMFKEPELKTNRHAHSTHDETKQGIRARFSKEDKRGRFSNRPQAGSLWARLSKRKIKRVLNTTDHVLDNKVQ